MDYAERQKFYRIIISKCDEFEKNGCEYLTQGNISDILNECSREKIVVTREEIRATCGIGV